MKRLDFGILPLALSSAGFRASRLGTGLLLAVILLVGISCKNGFRGDVPPRSSASTSPVTYPVTLDGAKQALAAKRFETARRICAQLIDGGNSAPSNDLLLVRHGACVGLADRVQSLKTLDQIQPANTAERLNLYLLTAEDYHHFSADDFYRASEEQKRGILQDEYSAQMEARADEYFAKASALATTDQMKRLVTDSQKRTGRLRPPRRRGQRRSASQPSTAATSQPTAFGTVSGTLQFPDGRPVSDSTVTLGLHIEQPPDPPAGNLNLDSAYQLRVDGMSSMTAKTDAQGRFRLPQVPVGLHEFMAVTLDPARFAIPTRFVARKINVTEGQETTGAYTVGDWQSAPAQEVANPFPATINRNGLAYQRILVQPLANPFEYDFPRQLLELDLPGGTPSASNRLLLLCSSHQPEAVPFQLRGRRIAFFAELPALSDRVYALYQTENGSAPPFDPLPDLLPVPEPGQTTAILDTGRAQFRIPYGSSTTPLPPLLAVRGEDAVWRGQGRFRLPQGISLISQKTQILEQGPLLSTVRIDYQLSNRSTYAVTLTAHRQEPYLLVHEVSPPLDGAAFEFSLREFSGGRGFLHWNPENGPRHWQTLSPQDAELARLEESVPWWVYPQGFGYAMTADGLRQRDYIGVVTLRRDEWIDRKFEKLAQGPGDANRELDWPYPEMVGSTVSMITANTSIDGDAFFRFKFFDGQRQWAILVSTLDRNDGPFKEISAIQHKNSSPRLQDFKDWRLDEQDHVLRPFAAARRDDLITLRKKKDSPLFAGYWKQINSAWVPGPVAGLRFVVDNDPTVAWTKKIELLRAARLVSQMHLLGRDFSDTYSPVGGRPIDDWAEDYDLIAASGVFTPDEERSVRRFLMLAAHMYMQPDLMNWNFNGRNANFEADRAEIVGTIGVVFSGNPDAQAFIDHAKSRIEPILNTYCTPGSGRWYENPACYYLQSMKSWTNLASLLADHGLLDPTSIPRLKDFLSWGVHLIMPAAPADPDFWQSPATDGQYAAAKNIRRIPPIGDHASLGGIVPEQYAIMAKLYRPHDPAFADQLLWAFQAGGSGGGYLGNLPQLFMSLSEDDLRPAPPPVLTSRRLEGFGSIFRGKVGQPDEFYLLFKQGPGGYRYQRSEGSFILFANGKPLIYDGYEQGETWRHSTLSFYDTHMPLAPGHVERFVSFPGIDFVQGVNPAAIKPGQPIQSNDDCNDSLVPLAFQRYAEPNPVNARSIFWVKDDYVVLHDALHLEPNTPSYWHLQVVADDQKGDAHQGFLFKGRFGTDLQVLLPDQLFADASIEQLKDWPLPMRHLKLTGANPDHYLAVLRPLAAGAKPLAARALVQDTRTIGVAVTGDGIDDSLWFARDGISFADDKSRFDGRYATVRRRADASELVLLDGRRLESDGIILESDGPAVQLRVTTGNIALTATGSGQVTITDHGKRKTLSLDGKPMQTDWPR